MMAKTVLGVGATVVLFVALFGAGIWYAEALAPETDAGPSVVVGSMFDDRWGRASVEVPVNVGVLYDPVAPPRLWLGFGAWTLSSPGGGSVVENWSMVERARFTRTGGSPVGLAAYSNLSDAQAGAGAISRVELSFSHTYSTATYQPEGMAEVVRVTPQDVREEFIVRLDTGAIIVRSGATWEQASPDRPILLHVPDADILIEDGCRTLNGTYVCT